MNIQDWFLLRLTNWISLQSKGLSKVFSNTTVQKHQFFLLSFLYSPPLTSVYDYWKNHSFLKKNFYFIFKLYKIVLVLPNIKMNPPQVSCVPHPEPSSLLPPHTIPLGRPSALAPSIQYCASNLDWDRPLLEKQCLCFLVMSMLFSYLVGFLYHHHAKKITLYSDSYRLWL